MSDSTHPLPSRPPKLCNPPQTTHHYGPTIPTLLRSGDGVSVPSATWSAELHRTPSNLPGYIIDTLFTSSVRYIRVTVSEARSWAQIGVTIYNGYTLLIMDHGKIPKGPMVNPASPRGSLTRLGVGMVDGGGKRAGIGLMRDIQKRMKVVSDCGPISSRKKGPGSCRAGRVGKVIFSK